jgi:transglutaminase-like putative cysteine protease
MWNACWLPSIPMPEPIDTRVEQFILLVLVCVAVAAFGSAFDQPLVWLFWLPCAVSVFWRIRSLPSWLGTGVCFLAYIFEALVLVLGLIFMAYPVLPAETATRLTLLAGFGLSLFASLFLLGTPVWPRAMTLFPATLGLLVVACFNPGAKHRPLLVGAGAAVLAYLSLTAFAQGVRKVRFAQWMRLASFALVTALVAATCIVVVPRLQSQTENITSQFFQTNVTAYSGLSDATRLGDLEELKLSSRVVMRVWTDHPQDLRARTYSHFDGRGWTARPGRFNSLRSVALDTVLTPQVRDWLEPIPGAAYANPGSEPCQISNSCIRTRILENLFNNGVMVSPGNKLLVRAALSSLQVDSQENLHPPSVGDAEIYGILNRYEGDIVQAGVASPQELAEALALPENTDARVRELATRLSEGASSPREKLSRTLDYLGHDYHYTLKVGSFHTSQPVAEFLFEKKKGYCQYFASAAAILLRQEGVATRYVSGFHVTENNRSGNHYVVREMDAHAWIESYIPGEGWVQADPTPAAEYESLHAGLSRGWFTHALEWMQANIAVILVHLRGGDWRTGLRWLWKQTKEFLRGFPFIWSGLTLAGIVLVWRLRHLRRRKLVDQNRTASVELQSIERAPELAQLLAHLDAYWTKRGVARPAHRAPLEHSETITGENVSPDVRKASRHLIETYYLASFGEMAPATEELRALQRECDCLTASNSTKKPRDQ